MTAYVTYRFSNEGVLVPDRGRDYPALCTKDTTQEDDLLALGLTPKELPVDHGDGVIEMQIVYVWPNEPEIILGLDDIRNYSSIELPRPRFADDEEAEEAAKSILSLPTAKPVVMTMDLINKSFYGYDVTTAEGMLKIIDALPIMDVTFIQQLALDIWPDTQSEDSDPELLRHELKGYLLDQLEDKNGPRDDR